MLTLPFTSDPAQSFTVSLGDVGKYTIDARYNDRSGTWTFDFTRESDQVLLFEGAPMLIGQDLFDPYGLGIGALYITDLSNTDTDAGPDDLGDRVIVTFFSNEELAIIGGAVVDSGGPVLIAGGGGGGDTGGGGTGGGGTGGGGTGGGGTGGGGTGGGGGTTIINTTIINMLAPLVDSVLHGSTAGSEELVLELVADFASNPAPNVTLDVGFIANSAAGTAIIRAYVGGTHGALDGVLVGSANATSPTFATKRIVGTTPNPGGTQFVKFTIQSSGATVSAQIDDVSGGVG